jgi:Protein phosphatase inhibitor
MQRLRIQDEGRTSGSQTLMTTERSVSGEGHYEPEVILRLQVVPNPDERRVTWDEQVIDNENMGKKSSKGTFPFL